MSESVSESHPQEAPLSRTPDGAALNHVRHQAPTNGFAITSLLSSFIIAPLGIIFGHLALKQIGRTGERGRGLAIGGLVIGYLGTFALAVWIIATMTALVGVFSTSSGGGPSAAGGESGIVSSAAPNADRFGTLGSGPVQLHLTDEADFPMRGISGAGYEIGTCIQVTRQNNGKVSAMVADCSHDTGWRKFKLTSTQSFSGGAAPGPSICPESSLWANSGTVLCLTDYSG